MSEQQGVCAICGKVRVLTEEHVPPKCAYNRHSILLKHINRDETVSRGEVRWRTTASRDGRYIVGLCRKCNSRTGSWYGTDYAEFAKAGAESSIPSGERGYLVFSGRPAAVAKEGLVCLCTTSGPGVAEGCKELRRLILSNHYRGRPGHLRLWIYLRATVGGHQTGVAGGIDTAVGETRVVSEFSHWPLGWVISWDDQAIAELCEVTHWLEMEYKRRTTVTVNVPRLWKPTAYPLDYRTPEQFDRDRRETPDDGVSHS